MPPLALNLFRVGISSALFMVTLLAGGQGLWHRAPLGDYLLLIGSGVIAIALSDTLFHAALTRVGAGINAVVPSNFWNYVLGLLRLHFAAGRQAEGLCQAAHMVGEKLRAHFPRRTDDRNELPDDISIG